MQKVFAVFPYVKTKNAFQVAGIIFRSSQDTEKLTPEEVDYLKSITSLFYLSDNKPIEEIVYTLFNLSDDRDQADKSIAPAGTLPATDRPPARILGGSRAYRRPGLLLNGIDKDSKGGSLYDLHPLPPISTA